MVPVVGLQPFVLVVNMGPVVRLVDGSSAACVVAWWFVSHVAFARAVIVVAFGMPVFLVVGSNPVVRLADSRLGFRCNGCPVVRLVFEQLVRHVAVAWPEIVVVDGWLVVLVVGW